MTRTVDAVLLDLGNVLIFHDNALLFRRLGERAGKDPVAASKRVLGPQWDDANRGRLDGEAIHRYVCDALGVEIPFDEFVGLWSSHFTLHDAVLPRVESLLGRVKVALVSNTNALHVEYFRPRLPLLERFDALVLSCEVGRVKPDPEIFREALRRVGTAPDRAAFFDDLPEYVAAARAIGIQGFLFTDAPAFDRQLKELGL